MTDPGYDQDEMFDTPDHRHSGDVITTAARAIRRCRPEPMYRGDLPGVVDAADRRVAEAVVDAVRPFIWRERDAELRSQIEGLPEIVFYERTHDARYGPIPDTCKKSAVRALLDPVTARDEDANHA